MVFSFRAKAKSGLNLGWFGCCVSTGWKFHKPNPVASQHKSVNARTQRKVEKNVVKQYVANALRDTQVSTLREQISNLAMQHAETRSTSCEKWKNISIYRALTKRSDTDAARFIRCGAQDEGPSKNRNVFQVAFLGCGAVATRTRRISVECDEPAKTTVIPATAGTQTPSFVNAAT
jgi:hypothetical protein